MGDKKRPGKRIPRYEQDEIESYKNNSQSIRNGTNDFISVKKLAFELTKKQKELIKLLHENKIVTITGPPGTSKAQPLSALLLTPEGWKKMGDIKINDFVIGADGNPTKVIGVFPQGEKTIYKISFSDGSSTECTSEHLWHTWTHDERNYRIKEKGKRVKIVHPGTVRVTEELIGNLIGSDGRLQYSIPTVSPINFSEKQFIIEPYLLGALLGDGHLGHHIGYSTNDTELFDKINNLLLKHNYKLSIRKQKNSFVDCAIISQEKTNKNFIKDSLGTLGLLYTKSYNKFIPEEYLFGSISQRIELLKGLLDTDGYVSKGMVRFSTSSERLKNDIIKLIQSLGGICKFSINDTTYIYKGKKLNGAKNYVIYINLPNDILKNCFFLKRKQEKVILRTKYFPIRYITNIEKVRKDHAQCIMVEDEKHLYITNDYILTHNTFIACYAAIQAYMSGKCKNIILSKPTEILSGTKDPGALPGSLEEKMAVYAESFLDAFDEILDKKDFKHLWNDKVIEFKPAQFLRGRTLKNSFIIIDEFQNFDIKALKSIVTRLGRNSTMIFMGDTRQNDIHKKYVAVDTFNEIIKPIKGCATFQFERDDIVRDQILIDIVDRFEKFEDEGKMPDTQKGN